MQFWWPGEAAHRGQRFLARLSWLDASGTVLQTAEQRFVHASEQVQQANFGSVAGKVRLEDGDDAQNAIVELLDQAGNVLGSTRTTSTGQYRFKNVDAAKYKLRVKKEGRADMEAEVQAAPAAEAAADFELR